MTTFSYAVTVECTYHYWCQIHDQNFPNPFNPTTTIGFAVASPGFCDAEDYDLAGKEVATLISRRLAAGNYGAEWRAESATSGVYFYRL